ncbi:MAG: hypothetical protein E7006_04475 [Alphaproteobacteria bacterium]|nr:hypothetical protein [Alphaproteobacteria bacterium]
MEYEDSAANLPEAVKQCPTDPGEGWTCEITKILKSGFVRMGLRGGGNNGDDSRWYTCDSGMRDENTGICKCPDGQQWFTANNAGWRCVPSNEVQKALSIGKVSNNCRETQILRPVTN